MAETFNDREAPTCDDRIDLFESSVDELNLVRIEEKLLHLFANLFDKSVLRSFHVVGREKWRERRSRTDTGFVL